MIQVLFRFASDKILITIDGTNVKFTLASGHLAKETTIEGLRLNYDGVIKEHPDLKGKDNWKEETIKRFKKHIKLLKTEDERVEYVMNDLKKHGYIAEKKQKRGHRIQNI